MAQDKNMSILRSFNDSLLSFLFTEFLIAQCYRSSASRLTQSTAESSQCFRIIKVASCSIMSECESCFFNFVLNADVLSFTSCWPSSWCVNFDDSNCKCTVSVLGVSANNKLHQNDDIKRFMVLVEEGANPREIIVLQRGQNSTPSDRLPHHTFAHPLSFMSRADWENHTGLPDVCQNWIS